MNVSCQCGNVTFKTPTDKPKAIFFCHCTTCRKQSASAFGTSAIFTSEGLIPLDEELEDKMGVYTCAAEESGGIKDCYFCKQCGVRLMHRSRDKNGSERGSVAIKGGLVEGLDWKDGIHIFTRSAVIPVPEGAEQYEAGPQ